MKLQSEFKRKDADIETEQCDVSKVIELDDDRFNYFQNNLLDKYDFLIENKYEMGYSKDGARHCLLVLPKDGDDGILVDAQGSDYARYSSFLPNARKLLMVGKYQSLNDFIKNMYDLAERITDTALKNQSCGGFVIEAKNLPDENYNPLFSYKLLGEMLSERPEFEAVEIMNDEILFAVAPEYQQWYAENHEEYSQSNREVKFTDEMTME